LSLRVPVRSLHSLKKKRETCLQKNNNNNNLLRTHVPYRYTWSSHFLDLVYISTFATRSVEKKRNLNHSIPWEQSKFFRSRDFVDDHSFSLSCIFPMMDDILLYYLLVAAGRDWQDPIMPVWNSTSPPLRPYRLCNNKANFHDFTVLRRST